MTEPASTGPASTGPAVITRPDDLDPGLIGAIADGRHVTLAPGLLAAVDGRCDRARAVLAGGGPVYGVNTGMGALSGVRLTAAQQRAHQRNLMLARAVGGPPWQPPGDVRAIFAVRLRTFLNGDAGVSAALCQRLADVLNAGLVPAVPRGGIGSAGEIIPLAHAFGPLAGIGSVLADGSAGNGSAGNGPGGGLRDAADALATAGLDAFTLGPKEGISLIAGHPGATALAIRRTADAAGLIDAMTGAAALGAAAARATPDPWSAATARGDGVLAGVLARLRAIAGEQAGPAALQAPVSFRVAGLVLAHTSRSAAALEAAAQRALDGVTDSPAFLGGRFTGTAGFHGLDLAAHCDQLTVALVHAAEVAAARIARLLDPAVTGLAAQLAVTPGPDAGLITVHKRAAGEVHAMRRLALATPVGLIESSGGQEDVQSFGWEAAENLRQAVRGARLVTACELLTAGHASVLAGAAGRAAPPGAAPVLGWLAGLVPPVTGDRPFGADIERLAAALAENGNPEPGVFR
jgi:histidine ammonia-lyase